MRLLQDGVVAALAAIGLTTLIFLFLSAIVHPRRRNTLPATAVVEACGDGRQRIPRSGLSLRPGRRCWSCCRL